MCGIGCVVGVVYLAPGLADGGLLVVAGHIVPLDAVSIEVVQDPQAGLQHKINILV